MKRFILIFLFCVAALGSSASQTNEKIRAYALCKVTEFYFVKSTALKIKAKEFRKKCDCSSTAISADSIKNYVSSLKVTADAPKSGTEIATVKRIVNEIIDKTNDINDEELFASLHRRLKDETIFPVTATYLKQKDSQVLIDGIGKKIQELSRRGTDPSSVRESKTPDNLGKLDSLEVELKNVQELAKKLNESFFVKNSNFVIAGGLLLGVLSIVNLILLVRLRKSKQHNAQFRKGRGFEGKKEGAPENASAQTREETLMDITERSSPKGAHKLTIEEVDQLKVKGAKSGKPQNTNDNKLKSEQQVSIQREEISNPMLVSIHTPVPQKEQDIYFAPAPQPEGFFNEDYLLKEFRPHASIFQITIDSNNPNQATFSIAQKQEAYDLALQFPNSNLYPVCETENTHHPGTKYIQTLKRGKLEKENDKWVVREKARIFFDDKPFVES